MQAAFAAVTTKWSIYTFDATHCTTSTNDKASPTIIANTREEISAANQLLATSGATSGGQEGRVLTVPPLEYA
jgi:hypothetical protein